MSYRVRTAVQTGEGWYREGGEGYPGGPTYQVPVSKVPYGPVYLYMALYDPYMALMEPYLTIYGLWPWYGWIWPYGPGTAGYGPMALGVVPG